MGKPFLVILLFLSTSSSLFAQTKPPIQHFRVVASWWNPLANLGSGVIILGEFSQAATETVETNSFSLGNQNLVVTTGVSFQFPKKQKGGLPQRVRLAIETGPEKPNDVFRSITGATIDLDYSQKGPAAVSKNTTLPDGKIWTVTLVWTGRKNTSSKKPNHAMHADLLQRGSWVCRAVGRRFANR